jgi:hypothetical protein
MSVTTTVQALGWIPVVWLLVVHLLHDRDKLPDHARPLRVAGFFAAATVVAGAVATQMWPLAALGVLWLRSEVFAHRHHAPAPDPDDASAPEIHWHEHDDEDVEDAEDVEDREPEVLNDVRIHHGPTAVVHGHTVEELPVQARRDPAEELHGPQVRRSVPGRPRDPGSSRARQPASVALRSKPKPGSSSSRPRPSRPTDRAASRKHERGPGFTGRMSWALSILFKIEIVVVVVIALVLLGIWSNHQRGDFNDRANHTLCGWMRSNC